MTTDTPRTNAEAEVKNYCDHKFVSVQECTLCGKTFDVLPSENECWENFEAVCNKIKTEAEVEFWKAKAYEAETIRRNSSESNKNTDSGFNKNITTTDTPRTDAEAEICKITQKTTKTPQNMTNKSTEVERLKEDVIAAQESEAVWKTEADKADQRRLEAEAEVERLREALDTMTLIVGLTPVAGNKSALQEAYNLARKALNPTK